MAKKDVKHTSLRPSQAPVPKGTLIAIGGKENKGQEPEEGSSQIGNNYFIQNEILERFVKELKGDNPLIAIIPTASTVPDEVSRDYIEIFNKLGVNNLEVLDIRCREDVSNTDYLAIIEKADGVLFTGGDQLRLTAIYGGTKFLAILKDRYIHESIVIAGTSAGAAAMSTPMIYEGPSSGFLKGDVRIVVGLEFLKDVAIDTHFISRGRIVRMVQAIASNPGCIGIGLEEDTGIVVTDGQHVEVIGSGLITVVEGHSITDTNIYLAQTGDPITVRDLTMHLLGKGDRYTLIKDSNWTTKQIQEQSSQLF